MTAINEQDTITAEALRKAASDWYQIERSGKPPELIDKTQPVRLRENKAEKEDLSLNTELIAQLETISPRKPPRTLRTDRAVKSRPADHSGYYVRTET